MSFFLISPFFSVKIWLSCVTYQVLLNWLEWLFISVFFMRNNWFLKYYGNFQAVVVFLLHFLIYCNACQIGMRGLKSCDIHPRFKRSSPISRNIIHMLDCLPAHSNTGKVPRLIPTLVFTMGTIMSPGVPTLTKTIFDARGHALKYWLSHSPKYLCETGSQGQKVLSWAELEN